MWYFPSCLFVHHLVRKIVGKRGIVKMRKQVHIFLLVGILGTVFLGALPSNADTSLSVPETFQEHSNWCWAGSSKAVLDYYQHIVPECSIANWAWGRTDCCGSSDFYWNHPCNTANAMYGTSGSLQGILTHWGVNSSAQASSLPQNTAVSEIDAERPFVMRFGWTSGGGHFLVGYGHSQSGTYLDYMDPWNGYTRSLYSWIVSASDHAWTHTLRVTTDPPGSNCSGAIPLSRNVPYNGSTFGAPSYVSSYNCSNWYESGPEKVHVITTTVTGDLTATLSNLSSDLDVFILSACNPSSGVAYGDNSATYSNAPPGTYYIVVDGYMGASGPYTLTAVTTRGTSIPGALLSSPALAWNPSANNLQMVVRGGGDSIWAGSLSSTGTFNNDWVQIPGAILDSPALAWNPSANKMQMVVRGGANSIWAASFSSSGAFNNDWVQIPGAILDPPAMAWNPSANKMQMVVRGGGDSIWAASFSSSGAFNNDWTFIPGSIPSSPALAWNPSANKMQMGVRGGANSIWAASFSSSGAFNSDWVQILGATSDPPALVYLPAGYIYLVVRGLNNSIWKTPLY